MAKIFTLFNYFLCNIPFHIINIGTHLLIVVNTCMINRFFIFMITKDMKQSLIN